MKVNRQLSSLIRTARPQHVYQGRRNGKVFDAREYYTMRRIASLSRVAIGISRDFYLHKAADWARYAREC